MTISRKIAIGYFVLGIIYIATSDLLLSIYQGGGRIENFALVSKSIAKGWIFIAVTSILLYAILSKYIRKVNEQRSLRDMVVNNTRDMLWMVDSEFRILLANRTFVNSLGRNNETELLGKSAVQFAENKELEAKWRELYKRALLGEIFQAVESFKDHNGLTREFDFHFYPVKNSKEVVDKVACFGHDITELKKYEAEILNQNEALKEITWIQSHELRKPLANIQGIVQAIDTENLDNEENRNLIIHLGEESEKLDAVIRKVVERATTKK